MKRPPQDGRSMAILRDEDLWVSTAVQPPTRRGLIHCPLSRVIYGQKRKEGNQH